MVSLALASLEVNPGENWFDAITTLADGVSQDRLTRTELQLLPVLATALERVVPEHPATGIAMGAKRRAAAEALLAQTVARQAAEALATEGLSVAPLKGIALEGHYAHIGWRRPMGDADLLVLNAATWEEIEHAAVQAGFARGPGSVHARNFDLPDGRRVDIHRFVSTPNAFPSSLAEVTPLARSSDTDHSHWKQLPGEFHMAHAIEHAMRWSPIAPARSISDIAVLQRTGHELDWCQVHGLLMSWAADLNGSALINTLVRAGILPTHAGSKNRNGTKRGAKLLQAFVTSDPRASWTRQPTTYFALIPWRLRRRDPQFSYRDYLRSIWSMDPDDSMFEAIMTRLRSRRRHGRALPQYEHH